MISIIYIKKMNFFPWTPKPKPETNSDQEQDPECISDLNYLLMHGEILTETADRLLLQVEPDAFINVVTPFSYNREIVKSHKDKLIKSLEKQYSENKSIEFFGLFEGIMTSSESIFLINGNHRYYALKEFLNKHRNDKYIIKNIKLEIFVFNDLINSNIEEDERVVELFEYINDVEKVKISDLPVKIISGAIKLLNEKYNDCIKANDNVKTPFINKKEFYNLLKKKNIHKKYVTPDKLFKKLVKINDEYLSKTMKEFYGTDLTRQKIIEYERATKIGFILGLVDLEEAIEDYDEK